MLCKSLLPQPNVGRMLAQHWTNIGLMYRVCCDTGVCVSVPPRSPPTLHDVVHGEITMQSGVNTTLRCDVQGVTPPAMLSWYLNGVQINQSSGLNQSGDVALEKDDDLFDTSILLTLLPSSDYYGSNVSCRMSHVAFGHALFTNASLDVTCKWCRLLVVFNLI